MSTNPMKMDTRIANTKARDYTRNILWKEYVIHGGMTEEEFNDFYHEVELTDRYQEFANFVYTKDMILK